MITKKAYTLVEILIVIGLILVLSTIVITVINPGLQQDRSKDAVVQRAVADIAGTIEIFKSVYGRYPTESDVSLLQAYVSNGYTVYNYGSLLGFNNPAIDNGTDASSVYWDPSEECLQSALNEPVGSYSSWAPGTEVQVSEITCSAQIASAPSADSGPSIVGGGGAAGSPAPPVGSEFNQSSGNPQALVAYYKMDESDGGVMEDSSGRANNGVFIDGPSHDIGLVDTAIKLNNSNQFAYAPTMLGSPRSLTMSAWVNPTSINSGGGEVVSIGDNAAIRIRANDIYAFYHDGSTWPTTPYSTSLIGKGWVHVTYVFDDSAVNSQRLYINGEEKSSTAFDKSIVYKGLGNVTSIGRHGNPTYNAYDLQGRFEEVKVYNYVRTDQQIYDEYDSVASLYVPVPQPQLNLRFNEASGSTAADTNSIAPNQNGTLGISPSNPTWNPSGGKIDGALAFDGIDDYVAMEDVLDPSGSFSLSTWIYPTNIASVSHQRVIIKDNGSVGWALSLGDVAPGSGRLRFFTRGLSVIITDSPTALQNDTWYHVVAVYDAAADTKKIYINGALNATSTSVTGSIPNNSNQLSIGAGGSGGAFFGMIDEVRIFNVALTAEQVASEYHGRINF